MRNNLLSHKNSGFKMGDGPINQILGITGKIYNAFSSRSDAIMVFLDIQKAFDWETADCCLS